MRLCSGCRHDPQPANYANPRKCAFRYGDFHSDNWNCVTINKLRALVSEDRDLRYSNDEHCAVLPWDGRFIVMTWYKERGRTGQVVIMQDNDPIRGITLEEAQAYINANS